LSKDINRAFSVATLKVSELTIDPRVQRTAMKESKVRRIVANFNPAALQVITVSLRKDLSYVILDGAHRTEAVRRLTDNTGTMDCHVLEGLTLQEEAAIFLDLNYSDQPTVIDRFRVSVTAEQETNVRIDGLVHAYGFQVSRAPGNGNINAVNALRQLDDLSRKIEAEPHLIQAVLLVISKAWGNSRFGTQTAILAGLGRLIAEHGSRLSLDTLVEKLKGYKGGPQGLVAGARQLAALRGTKVAMGVAELVTDEYNKGRTKNALPAWRYRS
jgi:hypothetical protein